MPDSPGYSERLAVRVAADDLAQITTKREDWRAVFGTVRGFVCVAMHHNATHARFIVTSDAREPQGVADCVALYAASCVDHVEPSEVQIQTLGREALAEYWALHKAGTAPMVRLSAAFSDLF